ncbi:hypothetical protein MSG28_000582 [Choristoneura fumiferana]|uniref:Uncharacterized protein n=1 Tax=Choristoneura fumiferana TaxID=7141 RepID=A0ACC0K1K1_CHOFU|nr:hypothetical protein MSG28_000582 [Choristoneura fumiferana]
MLKCAHCDKVYKYESERKRHQKSHFPQFECIVCAKKFSFLSALRRHQKQHERTGSVQCGQCGGHFRDETLLKRHIQYAHRVGRPIPGWAYWAIGQIHHCLLIIRLGTFGCLPWFKNPWSRHML